jgi:Family of unknown function (DUF5631)/Family of unknown function (DUF5632)
MPAFSSPVDCTPWVIGGLWPAELSTVTDETATLAEYLRTDLQRITSSANNELSIVKRAGLADAARHAAEARVIDDARARAVRRVESTIRQLDIMTAQMRARRHSAQVATRFRTDIDKTHVIPAAPAAEPGVDRSALDQMQVIPVGRAVDPVVDEPAVAADADADDDDEAAEGRHRAPAEDIVAVVTTSPEPEPEPEPESEAPEAPAAAVAAESDTERLQLLASDEPAVAGAEPVGEVSDDDDDDDVTVVADPPSEPEVEEAPAAAVAAESDTERLHRLLAFVVRQEPRLNWAVGDLADGTTLLVTDLAHGWIPPGIALPVGVRLLAPGRHVGKASALLGEATPTAAYTPGDPVGQTADFAETAPSVQARELPAVEDLGWELGRLTHWRDGLPRLVHTLAKAATAGTGVVEEEADLLRVHLDTARYQLLNQYPDTEPALLLNCLLLAATESSVAGDKTSANYHLAWFQKLDEPLGSQWSTEPSQ